MTNKSIVTALTFGFLAFTVMALPVATAVAKCTTFDFSSDKPGERTCPKGWIEMNRTHIGKSAAVECCTTPSEPYATGETVSVGR